MTTQNLINIDNTQQDQPQAETEITISIDTLKETLVDQLATLANRRHSRDEAKTLKKAMIEAVTSDGHYQLLDRVDADESAEITKLEAQINELTLRIYNISKDKKPVDGASVSERSVYTYDEGLAIGWAEGRGYDKLVRKSLVLTEFKKTASALIDHDDALAQIVKIKKEPTASIATDLSRYYDPTAVILPPQTPPAEQVEGIDITDNYNLPEGETVSLISSDDQKGADES